jgi:hypothetical protein
MKERPILFTGPIKTNHPDDLRFGPYPKPSIFGGTTPVAKDQFNAWVDDFDEWKTDHEVWERRADEWKTRNQGS